MNILVTGGNGQLGTDLAGLLARCHEVAALDLPQLDIGDPHSVAQAVAAIRPDVIVNCAAFTAVDACETNPGEAFRVNGEGPGYLAQSLAGTGGYLIHLSTDYVFDGRKPVPESYDEDDPPAPLSVYGRSKREGEKRVAEALRDHAVVRTAWLYGVSGRNFLKTMLKLALADPDRTIRVVDDQHGSPTRSDALARQLALLVEKRPTGVFHATGRGHATWYQFADRFLRQMGVPHRLVPCTTAEYPTPAARPANSILGSRNLDALGLNLMEDWTLELDRFCARFGGRLIQEARAGLCREGEG